MKSRLLLAGDLTGCPKASPPGRPRRAARLGAVAGDFGQARGSACAARLRESALRLPRSRLPHPVMVVRSGLTSRRGRTNCSPLTRTHSPACKPSSITRRPSDCRGPTLTRRYCTRFCESTTIHVLLTLIGPQRLLADQQGRMRFADRQANPHEHPRLEEPASGGVAGLAKTPRAVTVPVDALTTLLAKSI